jgi:choline kinase
VPKCLIKVGGEQILSRSVRLLAREGVSKITVVTGYAQDTVKQGYPQLGYVTNPFYAVSNTLVSLLLGCGTVAKGEEVLIINGDTVVSDLAPIVQAKGNAFAVWPVDPSDEDMKVLLNGDGAVSRIGKWARSGLEAIGVYKITPEFAEDLVRVGGAMEDFAAAYYEDAFDRLLPLHKAYPVTMQGMEIDTYEDYLSLEEWLRVRPSGR